MSPKMSVNLSRMHFPVTTLGPGKRIGIWFQGCSLRCSGCVSVDTWRAGTGRISLQGVMDQIEHWAPQADGVTVSGGEPFEQEAALATLLQTIKANYPQLNILVYSGYAFDSLQKPLEKMRALIDVLISEPFMEDQPSTHPWMGSANQKIHIFNSSLKAVFGVSACEERGVPLKNIDAMFDGDQLWMAGILQTDALSALAEHLADQGHKITHSQSAGQHQIKLRK